MKVAAVVGARRGIIEQRVAILMLIGLLPQREIIPAETGSCLNVPFRSKFIFREDDMTQILKVKSELLNVHLVLNKEHSTVVK